MHQNVHATRKLGKNREVELLAFLSSKQRDCPLLTRLDQEHCSPWSVAGWGSPFASPLASWALSTSVVGYALF